MTGDGTLQVRSASEVVIVCLWVAWWISWTVAALWRDRASKQPPLGSQIGYRLLGLRLFTTSRHWRDNAARWHARALGEGRRAWIIEAQSEPWEPEPPPGRPHRSCTPEDMVETVRALRAAGYDTILLWGVEHWLARDAAGDDAWLRALDLLRPAA